MTTGPTRRCRREAGFTLIDLVFVLGMLGMLSTLSLPILLRAKNAANTASALGTVRVVNGAQITYALTCGLGFFAPDLPSLALPPLASTEGFLPPELSTGAVVTHSGYSVSLYATPLAGSPQTCNGLAVGSTAASYVLVADPLDPASNPRYFGTNADGVIYEHSASFSGIMPETGAPAVGAPLDR